MKYQFRSNPPNHDVVCSNVGRGYEAPNEELAWFVFAKALDQPDRLAAHLKTRYTIEPFAA